MKEVNIGFIGLGARGLSLLKGVVLQMSEVSVVAVCDIYEDRAKAVAAATKAARGIEPVWETDYKK